MGQFPVSLPSTQLYTWCRSLDSCRYAGSMSTRPEVLPAPMPPRRATSRSNFWCALPSAAAAQPAGDAVDACTVSDSAHGLGRSGWGATWPVAAHRPLSWIRWSQDQPAPPILLPPSPTYAAALVHGECQHWRGALRGRAHVKVLRDALGQLICTQAASSRHQETGTLGRPAAMLHSLSKLSSIL